jgi:hypothetical protein
MKKVVVLSIIGLLAIFLSACSAGSQATNELINPGDQVGGFVFSTADAKTAGLPHNYSCAENGDELVCKATAGTRVNISPSYFDDTHKGKIEELWSDSTHQMSIEDRKVNLQAFGYIDVPNPVMGTVRKWNVAIVTEKPGEIIVHHTIVFNEKPDEFTVTWIFTEP